MRLELLGTTDATGRRLVAVATALALFAVLLAAPRAEAAWTAPVTLSGISAAEPDVAVNPNGNAIFAWERLVSGKVLIQARARSAAGVLSAVQTISPAGMNASEPEVAIDATGDAVFVWELSGTDERVQARTRSSAGVLGPVHTLSSPGKDGTRSSVAMDSEGDSVFVWTFSDGGSSVIHGRSLSATGVLGPVKLVSAAGVFAFSPHLATDADGDTAFVWARFSASDLSQRIQMRAMSKAGVLGPIAFISATGQPAGRPVVSLRSDPADAVFAWQRSDGTDVRIQGRARSAAGVLGPALTLSPVSEAEAPEVAVDSQGDAVFSWERLVGADTRIEARARSAAGALSSVQMLSAAGADAADVEHGVDVDGGAVFVWEFPLGADVRIQARTRSTAGVLGALQTLSNAGVNGVEPQIGVDATGDAVAVWERRAGTNVVIQAAAGP